MTSVAEFKTALKDQLDARVDALVVTGATLRVDPSALAEQMLAVVPRAHLYDEVVGPFHSIEGVRRLLGISRQAVFDRVKRGTLLQVRTSDDLALYPAFQFSGTDVDPRVRAVLIQFRDAPVDGWTVATWFGVPAEELGGVTPKAWLADPALDLQTVSRIATATATRWSMP